MLVWKLSLPGPAAVHPHRIFFRASHALAVDDGGGWAGLAFGLLTTLWSLEKGTSASPIWRVCRPLPERPVLAQPSRSANEYSCSPARCSRAKRRTASTPVRITIPPASSLTRILWPGPQNLFASLTISGQAKRIAPASSRCAERKGLQQQAPSPLRTEQPGPPSLRGRLADCGSQALRLRYPHSQARRLRRLRSLSPRPL